MNYLKLLLALAALLLCTSWVANANIYSVRIDSSVTNITTAPMLACDSTTQSNCLSGIRQMKSVLFNNRSASSEAAVNCSSIASQTPLSTAMNWLYAAGGEGWAVDLANLNGACFIESLTGSTISSGVYVITVTGG